MSSKLEAKFAGGMVGSALGDAIGEMAFRYSRKETLLEQVAQAAQSVGDHGDRTEAHRSRSDHGAQENPQHREQYPGGHRHAVRLG